MRLPVYHHEEGATLSLHIHCHGAACLPPRGRSNIIIAHALSRGCLSTSVRKEQHYHSTYTVMTLPVFHHV
ncbi:hypothetical protein DPMN_173176 [Dreissena polymorpha]|uniref:Uncharacterized protein n=1 Tax=Dreissena polymorpha TaxID=45954 RepID=A0A9D4IGQ1_DREPO|nr:hypothetical protein DPMN_173176 [Dreissena polymorpha]